VKKNPNQVPVPVVFLRSELSGLINEPRDALQDTKQANTVNGGQRRLSLGQEHKVCMRVLTPQCPQQLQLVTLQTVDARRAVLGAADVDGRHAFSGFPR
jgi:hypothetical protein